MFKNVAIALLMLDDKAVPNFYDKSVNCYTDLKNTFHEFGTLLHYLNHRSLN